MAHEYKLRKIVEFAETDTAGIVHFSNYFRYMEMTEHAFFRSLGLSIHPRDPKSTIGWPRIDARCEFLGPLRFEDEIEVHLQIRKKSKRSLVYQFNIRKISGDKNKAVARGSIAVVCVARDPLSGDMKAAEIPEEISSKLAVAPELQEPAS